MYNNAENYLDSYQLNQIYSPIFNASKLHEAQKNEFMRNKLNSFPTALVVLFHFLTFGIFTIIFMGIKHSQLPLIKADDFSAGKAIGFLFIPLFNLYWTFIFWLRLADRINFQFRF